ncbi:MAG: rRNA pseudouridine synthase [Puniceicoccales bacterium]|jgi:pseudouridine synthase|nr:rRNA pseudouridine synthase [Puniceicoccales bacterium]
MEGEPERLQKFLARAGVGSRRQGEALIREGRVRVNGNTALLGQSVLAGRDRVSVDGRPVPAPLRRRWVFLLHKPRGVVCTHGDPRFPQKTVFDFLPPKYQRERFFFCGRLDKESQGMLLLTNDGAFVQRVSHPSARVPKVYHVTLQRALEPEDLKRLLLGIVDDGEKLLAERARFLPSADPGPQRRLEIQLGQGRKREIRRLLEALGHRVHRLKRVRIGRLGLRGLAPGQLRLLDEKEIALLFSREEGSKGSSEVEPEGSPRGEPKGNSGVQGRARWPFAEQSRRRRAAPAPRSEPPSGGRGLRPAIAREGQDGVRGRKSASGGKTQALLNGAGFRRFPLQAP